MMYQSSCVESDTFSYQTPNAYETKIEMIWRLFQYPVGCDSVIMQLPPSLCKQKIANNYILYSE